MVKKHEVEAKAQGIPYQLRLNEFSDHSPEEWKQQRMGHKIISPTIWQWEWEEMLGKHKASGKALPPSVDWRVASGNPLGIVAVSPVKNQAQCGGCWAFATAAGVEGTVAVDQGVLNEVSTQQYIDCNSPPNEGCTVSKYQRATVVHVVVF